MIAGHFAAGIALKSADRTVPLWVLLVGAQLVDIAFMVFLLLGVEHLRIVPGFTASNHADLYYYPFTHSLISVPVWVLMAVAAYRLRGSMTARAAGVLALAVASHWLLDWVVHVPDLPIVSGDPKVGLGLWNQPVATQLLETAMVIGAVVLILPNLQLRTSGRKTTFWAMIALMMLLAVFSRYAPPMESVTEAAITGLVMFLLMPVLAYFSVDRQ